MTLNELDLVEAVILVFPTEVNVEALAEFVEDTYFFENDEEICGNGTHVRLISRVCGFLQKYR